MATFVEGSDLGVGRGGQATTQDMVRMLLCARVACSLDSKRAKELVSDGGSAAPMKPGAHPMFPDQVLSCMAGHLVPMIQSAIICCISAMSTKSLLVSERE